MVREAGEIYLIMMGFPLNLPVGSWASTHRRWTEFAFLAFRSAMAFLITQRVCEAFSEGSLSLEFISWDGTSKVFFAMSLRIISFLVGAFDSEGFHAPCVISFFDLFWRHPISADVDGLVGVVTTPQRHQQLQGRVSGEILLHKAYLLP
jgi:hypothetical protein